MDEAYSLATRLGASNQTGQVEALGRIISQVVLKAANGDSEARGELQDFTSRIAEVLGESSSLCKDAIHRFIAEIQNLEIDILLPIAKAAFAYCSSRSRFLAREAFVAGMMLAESQHAKDDLTAAISTITQIDMEIRELADLDRLRLSITASEYYLEAGDHASAHRFINRVHRIIGQSQSTEEENAKALSLRYKLAYARILEAERRFLEAGRRFWELSKISPVDHDQLSALERAITCAVLSKAGSARFKLLESLYLDGRSKQLKNYRILEIMHSRKFLPIEEEKNFEDMLGSQHNAVLDGGITVLKRAVLEHNILAVSQLYKNISIKECASLLKAPADYAESTIAQMIDDGRLSASIDQVDSFVDFSNNTTELSSWDANIHELCCLVSKASHRILSLNLPSAP